MLLLFSRLVRFFSAPPAAAGLAGCAGLIGFGILLSGCKPSRPGDRTPAPTPRAATPTPSPTPIYIPRKRMETANLFNGAKVRTILETEPGSTATTERAEPSSYEVEVRVKVKVPRANQDLAELSKLNESLPVVLPGLANLLPEAKVAPSYEALYQRKLSSLERNLERLDALLYRHDLFDCETILHLRHPETKRAALLVQGDMDVDTDGSDGDRLPNPDGKDPYFQPMTSYSWPKLTNLPNPFLARSEEKFAKARKEFEEARKNKSIGESRLQALRDAVGAARYELDRIRTRSFLLSETDPYIVLPTFMFQEKDPLFSPKIGDYCVVIYGDTLYPAIVGDAGPNLKVGEASVRLCKQLNSRSTAYSRPVSHLKVTYLVFPNSAAKTATRPDLAAWHARVKELLDEIGGHGGTLHAWETTWKPAPTPTPTPSPTPTPMPTPTPAPLPEPGSSPSPTAATSAQSPTSTPAPSTTPAVSPTPTPAAPLPTPTAAP